MPCELLDLRCIFVNELIGSVLLAILFAVILYFALASKLRLGFDTTLAFAIPAVLLIALAVGNISAIMAFLTVIVGVMVAILFNKIVGNR